MNNKEIFEHFEKLHSYSFATVDGDRPEIRIAHFLTYDDEGLYFQTMKVKPFYRQLTKGGKVAACALIADSGQAAHDENGLSEFPPGYFIRISGDVRELSFGELEKKAAGSKRFMPLLKDIERYPTMTTFVLHRFDGEIFDYDFARKSRSNKIERERFSHGGEPLKPAGFSIDPERCISCGKCERVCTFNAIVPGEKYSIDGRFCDECGSCIAVCPTGAAIAKCPMDEDCRRECGRKVLAYADSVK